MLIPSLRLDQEAHYELARSRSLIVGGRQFSVRQIVDWGALEGDSVLRLKRGGNRLYLEGQDYKGGVMTTLLSKRFLRFINLDLELEIPQRCLCETAREWLSQPDLKLMLMIRDKEVDATEGAGQALSKMISLYILAEKRTGEKYGLLLLNS